MHRCGTGQSVLVSLCVCRAACFVVFTLPIHSGLLCREDARSSVCHIRCVRIPIGYWPPTGAIPANQLSASWPFRWRPDPDGRWSVWLVAVSTGTAGRGGGKGPGRRARDFLGQSLLFLSLFLLSTTLRLEPRQLLLAALHCVSHAKTLFSPVSKPEECNHIRYFQACPLQWVFIFYFFLGLHVCYLKWWLVPFPTGLFCHLEVLSNNLPSRTRKQKSDDARKCSEM